MKNKLISVSLLSLLSLNIYASDFKVLKHTEKHVSFSKQQDYSMINLSTTCKATVDASYGDPERGTVVFSHFNYSIQNTSVENQTYTVTQDTCVINYGCDEIIDQVLVYAQKTGTYARNPYYTFYLPVGNYKNEATIQITGENTNCYNYQINDVYVK